MNTHDVLAFAVASEAVRRIRAGDGEWAHLLSAEVYPTSSRNWPMPDFVIVDEPNEITVAGEFKPPNQSRREYLTGLGQAIAYTRDFTHSLLIVPEIAEDDYRIGDHIQAILDQEVAASMPLGVLTYDPRRLSATDATFMVIRQLRERIGEFVAHTILDNSFWAKWRDVSPQELALLLEYLYQEARRVAAAGAIRDRAFARLWNDIQNGRAIHWGGHIRHVANTPENHTAWGKNYRNFMTHIGWAANDGKLTTAGLATLHILHQYGPDSIIFRDHLAKAIMLEGKHLVLINAINKFQDQLPEIANEQDWLNAIEEHLEQEGLLKRNPGRHEAARRHSARGFLKAEKTLWKNLGLLTPHGAAGGRVYHPGRGFIFDWSRITALLS